MSSQSPSATFQDVLQSNLKLTPMMEQYFEIKKEHMNTLLMYRMGDFYELFFDDAKEAARLLNISLTHRGKLGDFLIPMAGIPHHAASSYIDRITEKGLKVAICEQMEDPKLAKGIVKRAVTQIVSPGMPYDLDKAEKNENKFMATGYEENGIFYLVIIDFTTGEFFGLEANDITEFCEKVQIYAPKEFITYLGQWDHHPFFSSFLDKMGALKTHLSKEYFDEKFTSLYIEKLIPTYKRDEILKLHPGIKNPIGALSYYISSTQSLDNLEHFKSFQMLSGTLNMKISYPTLVGLEIFPKNKETYRDSILGFMDSTRTSMGARKLKNILSSPLLSLSEIKKRQDLVDYFIENLTKLKKLREDLQDIRDIERIMAKMTSGKSIGGDLLNLSGAIEYYFLFFKELDKMPKAIFQSLKKEDQSELVSLKDKINKAINHEIGANLEKGNLIKEGFNKERDRLFSLSQNASFELLELEKKYREKTSINNLKVKYNNISGYFIEVSKSHLSKVPKSFLRRQTLVNSERYQTEELIEFEKEILSAKDKLQKIERKIFNDLILEVKNLTESIAKVAETLALLDVFQSLAYVSYQENFTKPLLFQDKKILKVKEAFHPLIKKNIKNEFVTHDLSLDSKTYFGLLTGPNMAGKTTVMREMAMIQFLAQIGSYVPAKKAELGLCDYIFSRLGAHDDIIKGQSTFMVEMSETSEILRHATDSSLIILDEIGRGTSTYDGLSIAWALVLHFVNITKSLTLFSTHYHELIDLVSSLKGAKNLTVKTMNDKGNIRFLYELIEDGAPQSFGIHVAKLAGLPPHIIKEAERILKNLEKNHNHSKDLIDPKLAQLDLIPEEKPDPVANYFKNLDTLNITPLEALTKLHELKTNYFS